MVADTWTDHTELWREELVRIQQEADTEAWDTVLGAALTKQWREEIKGLDPVSSRVTRREHTLAASPPSRKDCSGLQGGKMAEGASNSSHHQKPLWSLHCLNTLYSVHWGRQC